MSMNNAKAEGPISLPQANLPGRKYKSGKTRDCRYCYFWGGRKKGCKREECWYLIPQKETIGQKAMRGRKQTAQGKSSGNCQICPYGRDYPCVGYCIDRLRKEVVGTGKKAR